jgi:hypothetical protein
VNGVNAFLDWLATKPAWAIDLAIWVLLAGVTLGWFIRAAEVLADEDIPILPPPVPVAAVPVTLDLGLFPVDLDALERTA